MTVWTNALVHWVYMAGHKNLEVHHTMKLHQSVLHVKSDATIAWKQRE